MDMLDEFDDYMNAQRKSLATKAITATTTVKMDAAKDTATTTDVEMDAATATIKMDAATATVEMDAATAAPKHKGSDSPAVVEIAIEKRKRCDSLVGVEINVAIATVEIDVATTALKIDAATSVVEIDAVIAAAKNWVDTARLLDTAEKQVVHNAKLYFGYTHSVVETASTNDTRLVALAEKLAARSRIELVPEFVKLMADHKKHMVELEVVSDTAVETLQRAFDDVIDNMIPKMPNLADMSDKLNDLRLRQARKAKTRRASSCVTGLV